MDQVTREQVLASRWRAHQLDRDDGAAAGLRDVALLDYGVQDTGPGGAGWALANRGLAAYDEARVLLAWTLRVSPHLYRRADRAAVATATAPLSEADAAKRLFDTNRPLQEAGIPALEALATVAHGERALVRRPTVKGDLSTRLTERLDEPYLRFCKPCGVVHVAESTFRMAALQAGLELEPGTSPPVLRRVPDLEPAYFSTSGTDPKPKHDVVRNHLRFYGPTRPQEVAGFLDAAVAEVRAHWPDDAVPVTVAGHKGERFVLQDDLADLRREVEAPGAVRLLGAFDGYLQLRDRELLVEDRERAGQVWRRIGRAGAVAADGELVGTWRPRSSGDRLTVAWEPWTHVTAARRTAVEQQAERFAAVRGQTLRGVEQAE